MNTTELLIHHNALCGSAHALMRNKNADYAEEEAPFKNFELSERLGLCSTEAGMAIRLSDKIQRLCGFLAGKDLKVKDESVRDTVLDAINYLVLISARLEENKSGEEFAERMNETVQPAPLESGRIYGAGELREACGQCFTLGATCAFLCGPGCLALRLENNRQ